MAVTQNTYTGNGSTTNYSFTFPYLETTDIKVSVNGVVTTAYTLANATTVSFNTAPANGAAIRIYRVTDDSALAATFYPGSAIRSSDLNDNFNQNLYVTQEINNYSLVNGNNYTITGDWTFSNPLTVATPTSGGHATTKTYVDTVVTNGVPNGNKGDITVTGNGATWTLNPSISLPNNLNLDSGTVYVDATNNRVGVGTSSPTANLEVGTTSGATVSIRAVSAGSNASPKDMRLSFVGVTADGVTPVEKAFIRSTDQQIDTGNAFLAFGTREGSGASTERLRITSDGKVGVGITGPVRKLVVSNNGAEGVEFGPGEIAGLNEEVHFNRATAQYVQKRVSASAHIFDTTSGEVARITGDGKVGVGTSSPNVALTVSGGAVSAGTVLTSSDIAFPSVYANGFFRAVGGYNQGSGVGGTIQLGGKSYTDPPNIGAFLISAVSEGNATSALTFSTQTSFTNVVSERARIDGAGRLLVGTSTARSNFINSTFSSQLQVEGTTDSNSALSVVNNSTAATSYLHLNRSRGTTVGSNTLVSDGDFTGVISFNGNDGTEFVHCATIHAAIDGTPGANDMPGRLVFSTTADGASSPTERMRITSSGEIITTSTFSRTFSGVTVAQYAYDAGTGLPAAGQIVISCKGNDGAGGSNGVGLTRAATSWSAYSDERAKTDLVPIDDGLGKVSTLRSVTGRYLDDELGTSRSFLIAQDVQAVLPEAVDTSNPDKLNLRYTEVIPLLVAALKESKERIETLEAKVAALESV